MTDTTNGKQPSVPITGAGSGLGRDVTLKLAAKGYRVFGTALTADEVSDLDKATDGAAALSVVDITDEDAVRAWAAKVTEELGHNGLDLLISNAGILTPGPLEVLPLAAVKHEFDVNVFGGLSVINALLPALRAARRRIVLIGAMTGRFPSPSTALQRLEGEPRGDRRHLPRRAEAVRSRRRHGPGRQHAHVDAWRRTVDTALINISGCLSVTATQVDHWPSVLCSAD
ncbi:SDR family NAD(P)-dependent oxidoreductase [Streptomyces sp. NPDC050743]|uniref:SDR family NAD(P)-dependent oxidoreductase n=1 Tax=Streptomyces sp. NPDC050743 TaxID=3365634 RepID=UPI0037A21CA1